MINACSGAILISRVKRSTTTIACLFLSQKSLAGKTPTRKNKRDNWSQEGLGKKDIWSLIGGEAVTLEEYLVRMTAMEVALAEYFHVAKSPYGN